MATGDTKWDEEVLLLISCHLQVIITPIVLFDEIIIIIIAMMMLFSHLTKPILVPSVFALASTSSPVIITSSHNKMRQRIHFVAFTSSCAVPLPQSDQCNEEIVFLHRVEAEDELWMIKSKSDLNT